MYDSWKTTESHDNGVENFIQSEMDKTRKEVLDYFLNCFAHLKKFPTGEFILTLIEASRQEINQSSALIEYFDLNEMQMCAMEGDFKSFKECWVKDQEDNFCNAMDF